MRRWVWWKGCSTLPPLLVRCLFLLSLSATWSSARSLVWCQSLWTRMILGGSFFPGGGLCSLSTRCLAATSAPLLKFVVCHFSGGAALKAASLGLVPRNFGRPFSPARLSREVRRGLTCPSVPLAAAELRAPAYRSTADLVDHSVQDPPLRNLFLTTTDAAEVLPRHHPRTVLRRYRSSEVDTPPPFSFEILARRMLKRVLQLSSVCARRSTHRDFFPRALVPESSYGWSPKLQLFMTEPKEKVCLGGRPFSQGGRRRERQATFLSTQSGSLGLASSSMVGPIRGRSRRRFSRGGAYDPR